MTQSRRISCIKLESALWSAQDVTIVNYAVLSHRITRRQRMCVGRHEAKAVVLQIDHNAHCADSEKNREENPP